MTESFPIVADFNNDRKPYIFSSCEGLSCTAISSISTEAAATSGLGGITLGSRKLVLDIQPILPSARPLPARLDIPGLH